MAKWDQEKKNVCLSFESYHGSVGLVGASSQPLGLSGNRDATC